MIWRRLDESGTTLIELLISMVLLTVVGVSLGASSMYVSKTVGRARTQLAATEFVHRKVEQLMVQPYDALATDSQSVADGTLSWTVVDSTSYRQILVVSHYAPAEQVSVWDSVLVYRLKP